MKQKSRSEESKQQEQQASCYCKLIIIIPSSLIAAVFFYLHAIHSILFHLRLSRLHPVLHTKVTNTAYSVVLHIKSLYNAAVQQAFANRSSSHIHILFQQQQRSRTPLLRPRPLPIQPRPLLGLIRRLPRSQILLNHHPKRTQQPRK